MDNPKLEWYTDFVDLKYKPSKTDLDVLFYFEPANGVSIKEAAGRIASESSVGTWTTLHTLPNRIKKVMATSYELQGNFMKIAYPLDLWEPGNVPQLLSGVAGNIFGMKAVKNLRLIDASLPKEYIRRFKGPQYGIDGIRRILKIKDRPLTGAVPKPKIGFSAREHANIAFETWMGGFDLCKDDENLTSTSFNNFEKRVSLATKLRDKAERLTGERKSALWNITGETELMKRRAKFLHNLGWEYCMIDVVTAGTASVQTMREVCEDHGLAIHAHRAMHASFDRNPRHGISMLFLAKLMRLIGVDQIHVGTAVGKLVGKKHEIQDIEKEITCKAIREEHVLKSMHNLDQNWHGLKPTLPVSSGGLHPGIIPNVLDVLGKDICLLVSGGIHGHPNGTRAGAKAAMQAIESYMRGIPLENYAESHKELSSALDKWGTLKPV